MANEKEKKFLLKDHLFNRARVEALAGDIQTVYSDFPRKDFVRETLAGFKSRELKERIRWMAELLLMLGVIRHLYIARELVNNCVDALWHLRRSTHCQS